MERDTLSLLEADGWKDFDPDAAYAGFLAALRDGNVPDAEDASFDLGNWLERGGKVPAALGFLNDKVNSPCSLAQFFCAASVCLAWAAYSLSGETDFATYAEKNLM